MDFALGGWVNKRRLEKDSLTTKQVELLDELGFDWTPITTQWQKGVQHLQAFVRQYKNCLVPPPYKSPDGFKLGMWVANSRARKEWFSQNQIEILDGLGFDWDPLTSRWENGFEHLQAYIREYNTCRVPMSYKSPDGFNLGRWLDNMRQNTASISPEQKARLDALGFDWNPRKTDWENALHHFRIFVTEHKHCRVPQQYKSPDGFKLGQWVAGLRTGKIALGPERIEVLDALGFIWKVGTGRGRPRSGM